MPCSYGSNKIIPAPMMKTALNFIRTESGEIIGTTWTVELTGTLVVHKGSPRSNGDWYTGSDYPADETIAENAQLKAMLVKQAALEKLFSTPGLDLEISPFNGTQALKCNPRTATVNFDTSGNNWTITCPYTISLEVDNWYGITGSEKGITSQFLTSAREEWELSPQDEQKRVWKLTHRVEASGKSHYGPGGVLSATAWQNARTWCLGKLGLQTDRLVEAGLLGNSALGAYDYTRAVSVGQLSGTCSVTESWTCLDPGGDAPAIETYEVSNQTDNGKDGISGVTYRGQIKGVEVRSADYLSVVTSAWSNARSKYDAVKTRIKSRAESLSGITLNGTPRATQESFNELAATIDFTWDYTNKPDSSLDPESLDESVRVIDEDANPVFARQTIPKKAVGPLFQDIETVTAKQRSVSISIRKKAKTKDYTPTKPNTDAVVLSHRPTGTTVLYQTSNITEWDEYQGQYSRQVSWIYY